MKFTSVIAAVRGATILNSVKFSLALFATTIASVVIAIWIYSGELIHPSRRPLQAYHLDWLQHPSQHGLRITSYPCAGGKAPCLFVEADTSSGPQSRGMLLRQQISDDGVRIESYGQTRGILVLLHGRKGRKEDLLPVAERFVAAGFKCVIPDLPSHGDSPINSTGFATTDAESQFPKTVLADARHYFGDQVHPAGLWGISMGGAFATKAAASSPELWKAIVIVSSYDRLDGVINDHFSSLPGSLAVLPMALLAWMAEYRGNLQIRAANPMVWATQTELPVFSAHGELDPLISIARGRSLHEAFGSRQKTWVSVPGADHNNILVTPMPLYSMMSKWLIGHMTQPPETAPPK